jgi:aryl-alcohol dehydrogenase-like predicted oxidoreductase
MWDGADEFESVSTIHAAVDRAINVIDTAPVYGFGRLEEIVGNAISEGRLRTAFVAELAEIIGVEG